MGDRLRGKTECIWHLCPEGASAVGALGAIENAAPARPDLAPNLCAVYTGKRRPRPAGGASTGRKKFG